MLRTFIARVVRAFWKESGMKAGQAEPRITRDEADKNVDAMPQHKRVTKELIDTKIKESRHFLDGTLTIVVIEMRNGFKFVGTSACVDPANFNEDVGVRIAYDNAYRQIWSHEGYCLADLLSDKGHAAQQQEGAPTPKPAPSSKEEIFASGERRTDGQGAFSDEKPQSASNPHNPPSD